MNIFDRRPLSLILCIMLGTFVVFSFYADLFVRIGTIVLITLAFLISFIPAVARRFGGILIKAASALALISAIFSFIYFDIWFNAYNRYDGEVCIVGKIEEIDESRYSTALKVKTDSINGTPFSKYTLLVYLNNEDYSGYTVGNEVKITGVIECFVSDESFDAELYYKSKGTSGVVNEATSFTVTDIGKPSLTSRIADFRMSLCKRIIATSNKNVGGLLCALLLGEKDYLPLGTKLDFSRIGISHVLALSGMHLAILAAGITKLLTLFGIRKKPTTLVTVIFTFLYMALTGFSPSVTRAGLMLIVSSSLVLLSRTRDTMTSLFIAVALIVTVTPYSIYDLSLWLSALATFGIAVMSEYQSENYTKLSFAKWIMTSLGASFFAIAATFAIVIVKFDGVSLLSPISTLVFSLLTEAFLYIGTVHLLLGALIPTKYLLAPVGRAILYLSDKLSDIEWIYVSTNFHAVYLLAILFSILFFGFFILKIKRKKAVLLSLLVMLTSIFTLSWAMTHSVNSKTDIVYHCGVSERIFVSDGGEICAVDITDCKKKTAYSTYAAAASSNITVIDKYVLTNYSYYLEESLTVLLENILIKKIYLPVPQTPDEETIYFDVTALAERAKCEIVFYEKGDVIRARDIAVIPLYNSALGRNTKNLLTILYNGEFHTYITASMLDGETKNMALEIIGGSSTVIFGRHESKSSNYKFTYKIESIRTLVFSSGNVSLHSDTLDYYSDRRIYARPDKISLIR